MTQSVTVTTAEDIARARQPRRWPTSCDSCPGWPSKAPAAKARSTSLFSRGGESDYNLVLIDGVRANLDGGQFDFSRIAARRDRARRGRPRRAVVAVGLGCDGRGGAGVHPARRRERRAATSAVGRGRLVRHRGAATRGVTGGALRTGGLPGRRHATAGSDGAFADILPEDDCFDQTAFDGGLGAHARQPREPCGRGCVTATAQGTIGGHDHLRHPATRAASTTRRTCRGIPTCRHAVGTRFTGTATFNYFRNEGASTDSIADPPFNDLRDSRGHAERASSRRHAPGAADRRQPEFNALVGGRRDARVRTSSLPRHTASATFRPRAPDGVSPAGGALPGRLRRGRTASASAPATSGNVRPTRSSTTSDLDNNAVFVQQQFSVARPVVPDHRRARATARKATTRFFSPKLSAGGFLRPLHVGRRVVGQGVRQHRQGHQVADLHGAFGGSFADPNPGSEGRAAPAPPTSASRRRLRTSGCAAR